MATQKKQLTREIIYNKLSEDIVYCRLKPGQRLIEDDLTSLLNVSRTPLREALGQLRSEGFVEYLPNKGVRVASLSVKEVFEIYSVRAVLEGYAAKLAAENANPENLKKLKNIHKQMEEDGQKRDLPGLLKDNRDFHGFIVEMSVNQTLYNTIDQLQRRVYRYGLLSISIPQHITFYIDIHKNIVKAISDRDSRNAGKIMEEHLLKARDNLIDFLEKYPGF